MANISGKETKPEVLARKYLFSKGLRYRKNVKNLPGKPDIVLRKYNTVVFINGCFWHGHENCAKAALPKTNRSFWEKKINSNVERDKRNIDLLQSEGWKVITVWQCRLKNQITRNETLSKLVKSITDNE